MADFRKRPVVIGGWIRFQAAPDDPTDPVEPMFLPVHRINGARPEPNATGRTVVGVTDRDGGFDGVVVDHPYADVEAAIALASERFTEPGSDMPEATEVGK